MRLTVLYLGAALVNLAVHALLGRWLFRMFPRLRARPAFTWVAVLSPVAAQLALRWLAHAYFPSLSAVLKLVQLEGVTVTFAVVALLIVEAATVAGDRVPSNGSAA